MLTYLRNMSEPSQDQPSLANTSRTSQLTLDLRAIMNCCFKPLGVVVILQWSSCTAPKSPLCNPCTVPHPETHTSDLSLLSSSPSSSYFHLFSLYLFFSFVKNTNPFFPSNFSHTTQSVLPVSPSQSHLDPIVYHIIHSLAKALDYLDPCPSITLLRKAHS